MKAFFPYLNWIESQTEIQKKLLKEWAAINTHSTNYAGTNQLASLLLKDFEILGGRQTRISLPKWNTFEGDRCIEHPIGPLLNMRKRPHAPLQILLGGHLDTVFPAASSFQTIIEKGDRWIGPGLTDMKGGLAILLFALLAFEKSPFAKNIGWEILINPDEEIGSPCSTPYFQKGAKNKHFGFIFEPSFPDGSFVSRRKGSSNYTVYVRGKAAHVGRDYSSGSHAIYALSDFMQELEKMNTDQRIVNVGAIQGGGAANIVPDFCSLKLNMRSYNKKEILNFTTKLQMIAKKCQKREGAVFSILQESQKGPRPFDGKTRTLFSIYEKAADQLGLPFHLKETGGACDGNTLAEEGLPTIDSIGAQGGGIHTHDEYLLLPSLVERAKLTTLVLCMIATKGF